MSSAPNPSMIRLVSGLLFSGTTTVQGTLNQRAAQAMARPWLPLVETRTPFSTFCLGIVWKKLMAPLILNDPVGMWFSCFTKASHPTSLLISE